MNVITVASRKGGTGKTTLTAHLAAFAQSRGHRCMVIDADPQGSLALCNSRRVSGALPLATAERGIDRQVAIAYITGYDWVFIDTPPTMWVVVQEAIRAATLVIIPARAGFLDLDAIRDTVKAARGLERPCAVVLNAAPAKRGDREAPSVIQAREWLAEQGIPAWGGQISQRAAFANTLAGGASAGEADAGSFAAEEMVALWDGVERAVDLINAAEAEADADAEQYAAA